VRSVGDIIPFDDEVRESLGDRPARRREVAAGDRTPRAAEAQSPLLIDKEPGRDRRLRFGAATVAAPVGA